ncbi:hypothetical protein CRX72_27655 [Pantoea sp. BRM17]|nr:hypothetical protein CRX72_27655 [Pantoea sp. BRM17]
MVHPAKEFAETLEAPTLFVRFADSLAAHEQPLLKPATTEEFDYEGELAVIIGKAASQVSASDALAYVAGYAGVVDLGLRLGDACSDLKTLLARGGISDLAAFEHLPADHAFSAIRFLPVIEQPGKVFCVGMNYADKLQKLWHRAGSRVCYGLAG